MLGLRATRALFEQRRSDIVSIACSAEARGDLGELLSWARAQRVEVHVLDERALQALAGTSAHEGVCLTTRPRKWTSPGALADRMLAQRSVAVALEQVRNPYNIGAILRSAAFFGVDAALLGMPAPHPALAENAVRVAEGGAEHLVLCRTTDLADTLGRLRTRGIAIVGAEEGSPQSLFGYGFRKPCVVVLGNEREGLSVRVRDVCDALVSIPRLGRMHSLNVSVAAAVVFAEIARGVR